MTTSSFGTSSSRTTSTSSARFLGFLASFTFTGLLIRRLRISWNFYFRRFWPSPRSRRFMITWKKIIQVYSFSDKKESIISKVNCIKCQKENVFVRNRQARCKAFQRVQRKGASKEAFLATHYKRLAVSNLANWCNYNKPYRTLYFFLIIKYAYFTE